MAALPRNSGDSRPPRAPSLAFDDVYAEQHDAVWRALRSLGVPTEAADDVTQEVFMVVHRRLPDFDRRAPVGAWIYGIARMRARKFHERARRPRPHLQLVHGRSPDEPDDAVAMREKARVVEALLARLDPDKREVFVLARVEGLTVPEIAARLGIKLNTAYSRLRAARLAFERGVARHRRRQEGSP